MKLKLSEKYLILVLLGILILLNLFSFPQIDDYLLFIRFKSTNFIKYSLKRYFTWEGAVISPFVLLDYFLFTIIPDLIQGVKFITFIWTLFFILGGLYFTKLTLYQFNIKQEKEYIPKLTIIFTSIFWISLIKILSRTLYWANGGYHIAILATFFVWLYYLETNKNFKLQLLLIFILGTSGIRILFIIPIFLIFHFFKTYNKKQTIWNIISFSISELVVLVAPGNIERLKSLNHGVSTELSISYLLNNYFLILDKILFYYKPYIIISTILLSIIYLALYNNDNKLSFLYSTRYLFAALSIPAIFSIMPKGIFYLRATSLFPIFLSTFFAETIFISIRNIYNLKLNFDKITYLYHILLFIFFSYVFVAQGLYYQKTVKPTLDFLNSQRYHHVTLTNYSNTPQSFIPYDWGIRENSNSNANKYLAQYFKLLSLKQKNFHCSNIIKTKSYKPSAFYNLINFYLVKISSYENQK